MQRRAKNPHKPTEPVSIMLAEYGSVRTESLEALGQIHTIVQYGLASLGVSVGLGLVTAHNNTTTGAIVLMGLSPTVLSRRVNTSAFSRDGWLSY